MSHRLSRRPFRPTAPAARLLSLLALPCLLAACQAPPGDTQSTETHAETAAAPPLSLGIAGRLNEHISLAADGPVVVAAWAATDDANTTDVYTAVSEDDGRSFSAPVRVNTTAGDARANGEQPPRVALVQRDAASPEIVIFWTTSRPSGTVLLTARSTDGGRTYGAATLVPGTDAGGNRGWQAIDADSTGAVHAVWLDHRRLAASADRVASHHHHGDAAAAATTDPVDTVAMAQLSDLYFANIGQPDAPRALSPGVCYCCKTSIVHGPDNAIYIAWRHVYPGNMRDIAFTTSRDGGRTFSAPVRVSEDGWSVAGCPDDGPSMTVDGSGRVHVVWPTVVTERGQATKTLFHAMTTDGRTFSPRVAISGERDAHHPQVAAAPDGRLIVAWDEFTGERRVVARATGAIDDSGAMHFEADASAARVDGRYPAVVSSGTRALVAWVTPREHGTAVQIAAVAAAR